jgi:hypothetical protein
VLTHLAVLLLKSHIPFFDPNSYPSTSVTLSTFTPSIIYPMGTSITTPHTPVLQRPLCSFVLILSQCVLVSVKMGRGRGVNETFPLAGY